MTDMRRKGTGCYDHSTATWKLRTTTHKYSASTRQLSKLFDVELPKSENASRPYWQKYLAMMESKDTATKRDNSPLKLRIWSIERCIGMLREQGQDTTALDAELQRCINVPAHDIYNADMPIVNPLVAPLANELGIEDDDYIRLSILEDKFIKPAIPKKDSLKNEIEIYIARHKAKEHKGWYDTKAALDLFFSACGDIPFREVDTTHYRKFLELLEKQETWGERTRINRQRIVHTFLKRIEADYNVFFGFIRNPDYKKATPDGKKIRYSFEQVQTALKEATGDVRFALLMGLNAGFYWSDLAELTTDHFINGERIEKGRAKNKNKGTPMVGSWLLWDETKTVLQYGPQDKLGKKRYSRRLWEHFDTFAKKHGLPDHSALRKTVQQWIEDKCGERQSRLYRCEKPHGNHGKYYSSFTPEQKAELDTALTTVHAFIFGK